MEYKNDVSEVIDKTATIENVLNQIIEQYCSPRKEAFNFFWSVLLDSSIISLGAKIKVVMAISHDSEIKLKLDSIHKLISYRNSFAHNRLNSHTTLCVGKDEDTVVHRLEVITNTGKIKSENRNIALENFNKHYLDSIKSLSEFKGKLKEELLMCNKNA